MHEHVRAIWTLLEGQRLRYASGIAALVAASCFLYLAPLVPQIVIDGVLLPPSGGEGGSAPVRRGVALLGGVEYLRSNLWVPALVMVALTLIAGFFTYLRGRLSARASESIARNVRDRLYDHLQHLPCKWFDGAQTGDVIQRCTSDVETLRLFLSNQVVEIGRAIIMLVIPIPLMLSLSVHMTIASVAVVPFVIGFSLYYFLRIKSVFKLADEAEGRMTATIQENLTGIRVVRAFARQEFEREKFDVRNSEHRALDYRLYVLLARFWSFSDFFCFSQKALVVGVGAWSLAAGTLQVGAFYFFLTVVAMFIWPVRMMGRIMADLGKAVVAIDRIREVLDASREDALDEALIEPAEEAECVAAAGSGSVRFTDVTFAHEEESPVLRSVSFEIGHGQTLAVLGPSGCGKSTIVNLLLRLYDYDSGSITLDGCELRSLDRKAVRSQIAVVMQEPFLYSKSLRENIRLGRPVAVEEEIEEATTLACVHEPILEFEDGYDTLVGERGVTLSGGQRQRVAIARALLMEPSLLILDDALSAVDTETESLILRALKKRHGRHTTIVIAHRISTIMSADQIIVLEDGQIIQRGRHEDLANEDGLYRRLWQIQTSLGDAHVASGPGSGVFVQQEPTGLDA